MSESTRSTAPTGLGNAPAGGDVRTTDVRWLFSQMRAVGASDLHLKVGAPPIFRVHGKISEAKASPYAQGEIEAMVSTILTPEQLHRFDHGGDVDLAYTLEGVGRFRVNVYRQRGAASVAVRRVQTEIPGFADLNLPVDVMRRIASMRRGLVLVCGVTGSGKSTTLAAVIEHINRKRRCHILTIEDPIEYLYKDRKAFINQREIGIDVPDFRDALKFVVRQDPDVILIGELRDRETFEAALMAAETGHLVFGTLHSSTVAATVGRILELFPAERERQVRQGLRFNLRAVVCQKILPGAQKDSPLIPALEILLVNPAAQKALLEGQDENLEAIVRAGTAQGMIDFNGSLVSLVKKNLVTETIALEASHNPDQLRMNLKGIFLGDDKKILG